MDFLFEIFTILASQKAGPCTVLNKAPAKPPTSSQIHSSEFSTRTGERQQADFHLTQEKCVYFCYKIIS